MINKLKHFENYIYLLVVTIGNYWVWQIFSGNLAIGVILLVIELLLYVLITKRPSKNQKIVFSISTLLFLAISIFLLKSNFDHTLLIISPTEESILNEQHVYLTESIGNSLISRYIKHYYSSYSNIINKYLQNIFYSLDPNIYFFRGHPRERSGINEYNRYSPFILPFFIIGVLFVIINYRKYKLLIMYSILATFLTGLISPGYKLGSLLMFPLMNIVIYLGFVVAILKIRALLKKWE